MNKKRAEKEARKILWDYSLAIGTSILFALSIRFFLLEAYRMPSRAMQPTVEAGDTLFVSKFSYGFRLPWGTKRFSPAPPHYGDVVVFEFLEEPSRRYIKRVVGLPGDRITIKNGVVQLNGKSISALTAENDLCTKETLPGVPPYEICFEAPLMTTEKEIIVPMGEVFVAGDFRSVPPESRRLKPFGLVPVSLIYGKAKFIWLSIQPPGSTGAGGDWFSRIRFQRLFKPIH